MHLPVPKAGLLGLSALFALVAAFAVLMYASVGNEAEAIDYNTTSGAVFCNDFPATFPTTRSGVPDPTLAGNNCPEGAVPTDTARDLTVDFDVATPGSNFGSSVITNTPGNFTAADAAIANGTKVGGLLSTTTLGLLGGPCTTPLTVEFILYDSETGGAAIAVAPEGTDDRFNNDDNNGTPTDLVDDGEPGDPAGTPAGDIANDNLADSDSAFVTSNLDIYETLFTDTGGSYHQPKARYTGATEINGSWQLLSFFIVDAGALDAYTTNASDEPHIFGRVSHAPTTGTLSLSILNDVTATQISPSPINDFCTPLGVSTMLLGTTPGGQRYRTPAAAGSYGVSNFSYSQRDADGDNLENQTDTCPFNANIGDTDSDGLDDACDPTIAVDTNLGDHDNDGFNNRLDNCPINANGGAAQRDNEADPSVSYLTVASDGGPKGDGLGDACDADDNNSVSGGGFTQQYNLVAKCIGGGADGDGDGYCATQDPDDADAGVKGWTLNAGMDQEYKNGGGTLGDHGDKAGGNLEVYWGTDPLIACGAGNWPYDLAGGNSINIADVLALKAPFGGSVPAVSSKFDLALGGTINIADVLALKAPFGLACNP
jgi:hypothetical protein